MHVTGRLISEPTIHVNEDKRFMTFAIVTNYFNRNSVLINCIRTIKEEPNNLPSYKKGTIVTVVGEPSINVFTKEGESNPQSNFNLTVNSLMVEMVSHEQNS